MLITKKVIISTKSSDFINVFLTKSTMKLFKQSDIKQHAIILEPGKQLPYMSISSLQLVELEIFKTYIKLNLVNRFI